MHEIRSSIAVPVSSVLDCHSRHGELVVIRLDWIDVKTSCAVATSVLSDVIVVVV